MFSTPSKLSAALFAGLLLALQPVHARTVRDINNQSVELPQQVNRIADLWPANNQVVLMLGGADKLVATTEATRNLPWFAKVYPRIKNVPALSNGQTVQSEALLGVRPDVVLLSQPAMQQQVRRAGMKPVLVRFQDFNGLKQTVRITADVIGGNAPQIARQYNAELDGNLHFVRSRLANLSDAQKPPCCTSPAVPTCAALMVAARSSANGYALPAAAPHCPNRPT